MLEPHGAGTNYTALVRHADEDGRAKHAAMGFEADWGRALEQLGGLRKARGRGVVSELVNQARSRVICPLLGFPLPTRALPFLAK